jgi:hypothetical protein
MRTFFAPLREILAVCFLSGLVLFPSSAQANWKVEPGTEVEGDAGWVWRLEGIEQAGSMLTFTLALRNVSHAPRTIRLVPDYPERTALSGAGGRESAVGEVGRAASPQRVKPGESATVRLAFERPSAERQVTLRAIWLVSQDMAADRWIRMELPVTLPE